MSNNTEQFLVDLESLLSVDEEKRYEKFIFMVSEYERSNYLYLLSIPEFDEIHNKLLNVLLPNDPGR
jgi:hypothetical protein